MAIIPLDIPDAILPELIDAIAARGGYQNSIPDPTWIDPEDGSSASIITNPVSKTKFARLRLYAWLRKQIIERRADEAEAIKQASLAQAEIDIAGIDEV